MADTPASDTATLTGSLIQDGKRRSVNPVDVHQAEADFTRVQRDLSSPDYEDTTTRAQSSTPHSGHLLKDLEKAAPGDAEAEERFDLREYLTSSNDANQAAGIKHKHVGVTWEDLEVTGIGGEGNKVSFHSA
jgi:ATP-binding cassette subfamily G (WHITE) protein 2 (SNQ2)